MISPITDVKTGINKHIYQIFSVIISPHLSLQLAPGKQEDFTFNLCSLGMCF